MLQVLFISPPITCPAFIKFAGRQQRPKSQTNTNLSLCPNVQLYLEGVRSKLVNGCAGTRSNLARSDRILLSQSCTWICWCLFNNMNTATLTNLRELNAVALKTSVSSAVRGLTVPAPSRVIFTSCLTQSCFLELFVDFEGLWDVFEAPHFLA